MVYSPTMVQVTPFGSKITSCKVKNNYAPVNLGHVFTALVTLILVLLLAQRKQAITCSLPPSGKNL